jgi:hypothetical protein
VKVSLYEAKAKLDILLKSYLCQSAVQSNAKEMHFLHFVFFVNTRIFAAKCTAAPMSISTHLDLNIESMLANFKHFRYFVSYPPNSLH